MHFLWGEEEEGDLIMSQTFWYLFLVRTNSNYLEIENRDLPRKRAIEEEKQEIRKGFNVVPPALTEPQVRVDRHVPGEIKAWLSRGQKCLMLSNIWVEGEETGLWIILLGIIPELLLNNYLVHLGVPVSKFCLRQGRWRPWASLKGVARPKSTWDAFEIWWKGYYLSCHNFTLIISIRLRRSSSWYHLHFTMWMIAWLGEPGKPIRKFSGFTSLCKMQFAKCKMRNAMRIVKIH